MKTSSLLIVAAVIGTAGLLWWYHTYRQTTAPTNTTASLYVVNVLEPRLHQDARIKGSINITLDKLEEAVKDWNKEAIVVFYCSNYMCKASGHAAKLLTTLGFKDVRAYEGGIAEWYQLAQSDQGYAYEGTAQEEYLKMPTENLAQEEEPGVRTITASELKNLLKGANL